MLRLMEMLKNKFRTPSLEDDLKQYYEECDRRERYAETESDDFDSDILISELNYRDLQQHRQNLMRLAVIKSGITSDEACEAFGRLNTILETCKEK